MISVQKIRTTCLLAASVAILSFIKFSIYSGHSIGFSYSHCLSPLIGILAGVPGAVLLFFMRSAFQICTFSTMYQLMRACHLPTLTAAFYLSLLSTTQYTTNLYKRLAFTLIPALCIVLFCVKTYGTIASWYSIFWFIPLMTLCIPHNNLYAHMLGSTFTAHAVGSVLWLLCGPVMTPEIWVGLMPVVLIERLLFASGMMISYEVIMWLKKISLATKLFAHFTSKKA